MRDGGIKFESHERDDTHREIVMDDYDIINGKANRIQLLKEAYNTNPKPVVYFSSSVDSRAIAYMVSLFENNLALNTAIKIDFSNNALNAKLLKDLCKSINSAFVNSNYIFKDEYGNITSDHINSAKTLGYNYSHIDILDTNDDIILSVPQRYQIENELRELNNGKPEYKAKLAKGRHLQELSVGANIKNYDNIIVYTNFMVDDISGYSGSIKNIGYGIASAKVGKMQIHDRSMQHGNIYLERMVEAASAVEALFHNRAIYVNVLAKMGSNIPDIGVLVSNDILAIEQASLDFIRNSPKNKVFIEHIGSKSGYHILEYAEWLRMGNRQYTLRDIADNSIIKLENVLSETKRFELPDSAFGIPEDRKFPLDTAQRVKSAIKLFGHAEESKKKSLAKRIQAAAKKYDISIPETTQCYKYLHESEIFNNMEDVSDYILLKVNDNLVNLPLSSITWWYLSDSKKQGVVDSDLYYKTLDQCVKIKCDDCNRNNYFENNLYYSEYVYISNLSLDKSKHDTEEHKLTLIGEINIYPSGDYEWIVQYPIKLVNREILPLSEYSMAATNPVIGIAKPFVVNTGESLGYMNDIESDRILTVNSDNVLEVVPSDNVSVREVYEFIGNKAYIDRLNKYYKESTKVDNIYTILTNKPLLTEDQIDFDPSFKKVDFDFIEQKILSEFATLRDNIIEACGMKKWDCYYMESTIYKTIPEFVNKYNDFGDIQIKEDFDGVYFYSNLTKKRSASVASTNMLTENMLKVIL